MTASISPLYQVMTLKEVTEKYDIKLETLKSRVKRKSSKKSLWATEGIARQSGDTWLVTEEFMKSEFPYVKRRDETQKQYEQQFNER